MRQFSEISGSSRSRMTVTIRQVYEAGGRLIVLAHLARQRHANQLLADSHQEIVFRDQTVVETSANDGDELPVTYVLVDIDPEEAALYAKPYPETFQLRGVNRSGQFELSNLGKPYRLPRKAELKYHYDPDQRNSFRIGSRPIFRKGEESANYARKPDLQSVFNIYTTCLDGVYKVVLEAISCVSGFSISLRDLFPNDEFAGCDFSRKYKPTIEAPIFFNASVNNVVKQYHSCAISLEVPADDLTAVVRLIEYLDAAWANVFFRHRKFDCVQISSASVFSCYADPWFVNARMSETDKCKYRQILNQPIALDLFLAQSLRYDYRDSIRTVICSDVLNIEDLSSYRLLQEIYRQNSQELNLRQLHHCPVQVLVQESEVRLHELCHPETTFEQRELLIGELELFLNKQHDPCARLKYRYLLDRFNSDYVKGQHSKKLFLQERNREFLHLAKFDLLEDGRMCILLGYHHVYLRYFASEREAGKNFLSEFARVIGVEFDSDTDYQSRLIFTPASTRHLKSYGFHLCGSYWDKAVEKKNHLKSYPASNSRLFGGSAEKKPASFVLEPQHDSQPPL